MCHDTLVIWRLGAGTVAAHAYDCFGEHAQRACMMVLG